jgi:hypothetical protein
LFKTASIVLAFGRAPNGWNDNRAAAIIASFVSACAGLLIRPDDFVAIRAGSIRQSAAWNDKIGIPPSLRFLPKVFRRNFAGLANGRRRRGSSDAEGFYGAAVASGECGFNTPAAVASRF